LVYRGTNRADHARTRVARERYSGESDRACSALNHDRAPANAATNVNRPVSSDAGNAEACALIHRHFFGQ
jgi:hypothetical protein